jgi:hypothetical protein
MAAAKLSDETFSAILEANPGLRERFASIAMAVANSGENLKAADAIEERIVEEMRVLGREAMQGWAETQVKATEKEIRQASQDVTARQPPGQGRQQLAADPVPDWRRSLTTFT